MKDCTNCKHAEWHKTTAGKLHPSGEGKCTYKYSVPKLPASMFWMGMRPPEPYGGGITRRKQLSDHCVYFERG